MVLFVISVAILYLLAEFSGNVPKSFSREKSYAIRAFLAIIIVLHHLSRHYGINNFSEFYLWGPIVVSFFLFMSGYGLLSSYCKNGKYLKNFLRKRVFCSIVLPYLCCLAIYLLLFQENISTYMVYNLVANGINVLPNAWYVFTIIVLYVCFYVSAKFMGRYMICGIIAFNILYICFTMAMDYPPCWYVSSLGFSFGVVYRKYEYVFLSLYNMRWLYGLLQIGCMFAIGCLFALHNPVAKIMMYIPICLMLVGLLSKIRIEDIGKYKVIVFLSGLSYEIYLLHGVAMQMLRGGVCVCNFRYEFCVADFCSYNFWCILCKDVVPVHGK